MNLPITKFFTSIRTEGPYNGVPSIFIQFDNKSESPYSSIIELVEAFDKELQSHPKIKHMVIFGDEPMKYKSELNTLLKCIFDREQNTTIEIITDGNNQYLNPLNGKYHVSLYNVHLNVNNVDIEKLVDLVTSTNYIISFDYKEGITNDIMKIYQQMGDVVGSKDDQFVNFYMRHHPIRSTWLISDKKHSEDAKNICIANGWNYTQAN